MVETEASELGICSEPLPSLWQSHEVSSSLWKATEYLTTPMGLHEDTDHPHNCLDIEILQPSNRIVLRQKNHSGTFFFPWACPCFHLLLHGTVIIINQNTGY